MADPNISLQLRMATVPEQTAEHASQRRPRSWKFTFGMGRFIKQMIVLAVVGLLSALCFLLISRYFMQTIQVVGESMVPTLQQGGHYILNRWAFHNHAPHRGDVVVIRDPADHGFSVKRIVALAGESVHFLNGKVYVDGQVLPEPYLDPHTYTFTYARAHEQFISCGKDQYFVLGDNRPNSIDSRAYGPVPREDILGRVMLPN